ncbi:MAG: DNA-binding protein [Candidatus Methylomirabilota bacterium]|nr:HEPN domain-containing protein [Candidatus Methylomirabilis sp.]NJD69556.1 HEPN domain-containing protein [candidate division NC10 bacterium]PWB46150.1 MAG: DNA-binding protein [candidate division NC10 bacterium]
MTSRDLAGSLMRQAESRKATLQVAMGEENWAYVVRLSQEIVELSLKAILNFVGVEPPKWHDVGTLMVKYSRRLPADIALRADELARISARLRENRERSMYGDELLGQGPDDLYGRPDAEQARRWAEEIFNLCRGHMTFDERAD